MNKKVIKFGAMWCGPCRAYAPIWDKVKESTEGWQWEAYDADANTEEVIKYDVKSIPTTVFEVDGEIVETHRGILNAADLKKKLEKHSS